MLFAELVTASRDVAATPGRRDKVARLAALVFSTPTELLAAVISFLVGEPRQGRIGVGWATLSGARVEPAAASTLTVADVDGVFERVVSARGAGSREERTAVLTDLFARATEPEQAMLAAIVGGELRHGALAGVLTDAVARAADVPVAAVRRAAMLSGSLAGAAVAARRGGLVALDGIDLAVLHPVQPMLASPAGGVAEALVLTGPASVEYKLDGARIQVHRSGGQVRIFTRNLNDVTDRLVGVVDAVARLDVDDVVLDGEVLGLADDGRPRAFQDTMGDLTATSGDGRGSLLRPWFFDVLHADGETVIDRPLAERRAVLTRVLPAELLTPATATQDPDVAAQFLDAALAAGHEGVVVKALDSSYDAGRRGGSWRKVKPVHTLDLVVLAAEWGHGRRRGWLSNLHLAACGPDGTFVMVGKTFKGLTDELLTWQTERLQQLALGTESSLHSGATVVHVRPELVVEVAVDGVQTSRRYPGGVALRFARVRRYRQDKPAAEADTIARVRSLAR